MVSASTALAIPNPLFPELAALATPGIPD